MNKIPVITVYYYYYSRFINELLPSKPSSLRKLNLKQLTYENVIFTILLQKRGVLKTDIVLENRDSMFSSFKI